MGSGDHKHNKSFNNQTYCDSSLIQYRYIPCTIDISQEFHFILRFSDQ